MDIFLWLEFTALTTAIVLTVLLITELIKRGGK